MRINETLGPFGLGWEPGTEYLGLLTKQVEMAGAQIAKDWGYILQQRWQPFGPIWFIFLTWMWEK